MERLLHSQQEMMIGEIADIQQKRVKTDNESENGLTRLKALSIVVVDSGDFEVMKDLKPEDATTNPSLILQASQKENYQYLIDKAIEESIHEIREQIRT